MNTQIMNRTKCLYYHMNNINRNKDKTTTAKYNSINSGDRTRTSPFRIHGALHLATASQRTQKDPQLACKSYLNFTCYTAETVTKQSFVIGTLSIKPTENKTEIEERVILILYKHVSTIQCISQAHSQPRTYFSKSRYGRKWLIRVLIFPSSPNVKKGMIRIIA